MNRVTDFFLNIPKKFYFFLLVFILLPFWSANAALSIPNVSISKLDSDINLEWQAVSTAVEYHIYRSATPYFLPDNVIASTANTNFTDSNADLDGVNYFYQVIAEDGEGVLSLPSNEVGLFHMEILPGFNLLSWPIIPSDTTLDAVLGIGLFGTEDPLTADRVLIWDGETQTYESAWFCGGTVCESFGPDFFNHWLANDFSQSTLSIEPDSGFWLQNRSGEVETLSIVGEVAIDNRNVSIDNEWQMLGLAFPDNRPLNQASLPATGTADPLTADRMLYWDAASQTYEAAWYCGGATCETFGSGFFNLWLANDFSQTSIVLEPGHGFWFQNRHAPLSWSPASSPNNAPDLFISKSDNGIVVAPGSVANYTVTYRNEGVQAATGVVITETVPLNSVFDAGNSSSGWTQVGGSDQFTFDIGELAAGESGELTFSIIVDDPLPNGIDMLTNTVVIGDDGIGGEDLNLLNNNATDNTLLSVGAPVLDPIGDQIIPLGTTLELTVAAVDPEDHTLTFTIDPLPLPANMSLNASDGSLSFTPDETQVGDTTLTIMVSDGEFMDAETVTFTVTTSGTGITTLQGQVLTEGNVPLENVRLEIGTEEAFTDVNGNFFLNNLPSGEQRLLIDGSLIDAALGTFATVPEVIHLIDGADNVLTPPIYLLPLDVDSADPIDPENSSMITSSMIEIEGEMFDPIIMTVDAGSATLDETGDAFDGMVHISQISDPALGPRPLPNDLTLSIYVAVQPFGVSYDPPAEISFPNVEGFPADSIVDIMGLNHDTGVFEVVGQGEVSSDGLTIDSIGGVITDNSWHGIVPQQPVVSPDPDGGSDEQGGTGDTRCESSAFCLQTGGFSEDHTLVSYRSFGVERSLRLTYHSMSANPNPILPFVAGVGNLAPPPLTMSTNLSVAGVNQGEELFAQPSLVPDPNVFGQFLLSRPAVQFDASLYPSGVYGYDLTVDCQFPSSSRSETLQGEVIIQYERHSPFGVGWTLAGLHQLHINAEGVGLITDGDGVALAFQPAEGGTFTPPLGDYSTLTENEDGTFTRLMKDGTSYLFDSNGRQLSMSDRNGNSTVYTYDGFDRLSSIIDPAGLITTLTYGGDGLIDTISDPANRITQFIHDDAGDLVEIIDPDGSHRTFGYEAESHLMISQTNQREFTTQYHYGSSGRIAGSTLPDGATTQLQPNQTQGLVDTSSGFGSESNPAPPPLLDQDVATFYVDRQGRTTTYETDGFGRTTQQVDALGQITSILRDEDSNPIEIVRPNSSVVTFGYDEQGNMLTNTEWGFPTIPDPAFPATTTFTYEGTFNQVTSIVDPLGNPTTINYDGNGNPIEIIDALGTVTELAYGDLDCPGQISSITSALNLAEESVTQFSYNALCNLETTTDAVNNVTSFSYDEAGNVVSTIDGEGRETRFAYDDLNRLTKVIDATNSATNPACGQSGVTCYSYDLRGNLTAIEDANGNVTNFSYDELDRVIGTVDPVGQTETFTYDFAGNLTSFLSRNGDTIEFTYNAIDQLMEKTWNPDAVNEMVTSYAYDSVGNLRSVEDDDSVVTYKYDASGRPVSASTEVDTLIAAGLYEGGHSDIGMFDITISEDGTMIETLSVDSFNCGGVLSFVITTPISLDTNGRFSAQDLPTDLPDGQTITIDGVFFDVIPDAGGVRDQAIGGVQMQKEFERCHFRWAASILPDDDGDGWSTEAEELLIDGSTGSGIEPEHALIPTTQLLGPDSCHDGNDNDFDGFVDNAEPSCVGANQPLPSEPLPIVYSGDHSNSGDITIFLSNDRESITRIIVHSLRCGIVDYNENFSLGSPGLPVDNNRFTGLNLISDSGDIVLDIDGVFFDADGYGNTLEQALGGVQLQADLKRCHFEWSGTTLVDDDEDGWSDAAEYLLGVTTSSASNTPEHIDLPTTQLIGVPPCFDGDDNDNDGIFDSLDSDCIGTAPPLPTDQEPLKYAGVVSDDINFTLSSDRQFIIDIRINTICSGSQNFTITPIAPGIPINDNRFSSIDLPTSSNPDILVDIDGVFFDADGFGGTLEQALGGIQIQNGTIRCHYKWAATSIVDDDLEGWNDVAERLFKGDDFLGGEPEHVSIPTTHFLGPDSCHDGDDNDDDDLIDASDDACMGTPPPAPPGPEPTRFAGDHSDGGSISLTLSADEQFIIGFTIFNLNCDNFARDIVTIFDAPGIPILDNRFTGLELATDWGEGYPIDMDGVFFDGDGQDGTLEQVYGGLQLQAVNERCHYSWQATTIVDTDSDGWNDAAERLWRGDEYFTSREPEHIDIPTTQMVGPSLCEDGGDSDNDDLIDAADDGCIGTPPPQPTGPEPLVFAGNHSNTGDINFTLSADRQFITEIRVQDLFCSDSQSFVVTPDAPGIPIVDNRFSSLDLPTSLSPDSFVDIDGVFFDADGFGGTVEQALGGIQLQNRSVSTTNYRCHYAWTATSIVDDDEDGWADVAERLFKGDDLTSGEPEHVSIPTTQFLGPDSCHDGDDNDNDDLIDAADDACMGTPPPAPPSPEPTRFEGNHSDFGNISLSLSADRLFITELAIEDLSCDNTNRDIIVLLDAPGIPISSNRFTGLELATDWGEGYTIDMDGVFFDGDGQDGTLEQVFGGLQFQAVNERCHYSWRATTIVDNDRDGWNDTAERLWRGDENSFNEPEHINIPTTPLIGPSLCEDGDDSDNDGLIDAADDGCNGSPPPPPTDPEPLVFAGNHSNTGDINFTLSADRQFITEIRVVSMFCSNTHSFTITPDAPGIPIIDNRFSALDLPNSISAESFVDIDGVFFDADGLGGTLEQALGGIQLQNRDVSTNNYRCHYAWTATSIVDDDEDGWADVAERLFNGDDSTSGEPEHVSIPTTQFLGPDSCHDGDDNDNDGLIDAADDACSGTPPPVPPSPEPIRFSGNHSDGGNISLTLSIDRLFITELAIEDLSCDGVNRDIIILIDAPGIAISSDRFTGLELATDWGEGYTIDMDGVFFDGDGQDGTLEQVFGGLQFQAVNERCHYSWRATTIVDNDRDGWNDTAERLWRGDENSFNEPEHINIPTTPLIGPSLCEDGDDSDNDGLIDAADDGCIGAPPPLPTDPEPLVFAGNHSDTGDINLTLSADRQFVTEIRVQDLFCSSNLTFIITPTIPLTITTGFFSGIGLPTDLGNGETADIDGILFDADGLASTSEQALGGVVIHNNGTDCAETWYTTTVVDDDEDGWSDTAERLFRGDDSTSGTAEHQSIPTTPLFGPDVCSDGLDNDNDGNTDGADLGCTTGQQIQDDNATIMVHHVEPFDAKLLNSSRPAFVEVSSESPLDDSDSSLHGLIEANNGVDNIRDVPVSKKPSVSTPNQLAPVQPIVEITYTYDKNGNRLSMTDLTGVTVYEYDELNRLISITNPLSQTVAFGYDALNRRTNLTMPNGVETTYSYDPAGQLLSLVNELSGSTVSSYAYTYDGVGNRTSMTQNRSAIEVNAVLTYMYDDLNRLIDATNPLPTIPNETFQYDAVGNRLLRDGQTNLAQFDGVNRLLEDEDYCYGYDANGNLTSKEAKVGGICDGSGELTTYGYDPESQLVEIQIDSVVIGSYRYDGLGRRIEKVANGQTIQYVYDNEDIVLEYDDDSNVTARYTHGPGIDEPLIMARDLNSSGTFDSGETYFYHTDGLGSITDITNESGAVEQAYVYDAYGQVVAAVCGSQTFNSVEFVQGALAQPATCLTNPYTYTSREYDAESGLYFYRARYYDSSLGRFLQKDPHIGFFYIPQSINLYLYVRNRPLILTDPSGLVTDQFSYLDEFNDPIFDEFTKPRRDILERKDEIASKAFYNSLPFQLLFGAAGCAAGAFVAGPVGCAAGITIVGAVSGIVGIIDASNLLDEVVKERNANNTINCPKTE